MKRSSAGLFLLLVALLIPLNVAYLYHAYYQEIDFLPRKHFTEQDEEDFLTVVKKNPRLLYYPGFSGLNPGTFLLDISFLKSFSSFLPQNVSSLVLRC